MTTQPAALQELQGHPDYALAVPTPEHFLPLAFELLAHALSG